MHAVIGFLILAGTACFVIFAFRQGMGVRREKRRDNMIAYGMEIDVSRHNHDSGAGLGQ